MIVTFSRFSACTSVFGGVAPRGGHGRAPSVAGRGTPRSPSACPATSTRTSSSWISLVLVVPPGPRTRSRTALGTWSADVMPGCATPSTRTSAVYVPVAKEPRASTRCQRPSATGSWSRAVSPRNRSQRNVRWRRVDEQVEVVPGLQVPHREDVDALVGRPGHDADPGPERPPAAGPARVPDRVGVGAGGPDVEPERAVLRGGVGDRRPLVRSEGAGGPVLEAGGRGPVPAVRGPGARGRRARPAAGGQHQRDGGGRAERERTSAGVGPSRCHQPSPPPAPETSAGATPRLSRARAPRRGWDGRWGRGPSVSGELSDSGAARARRARGRPNGRRRGGAEGNGRVHGPGGATLERMEFRRIHALPPYAFAEIDALKVAARRSDVDVIDLGLRQSRHPVARDRGGEAGGGRPEPAQPPVLGDPRACPGYGSRSPTSTGAASASTWTPRPRPASRSARRRGSRTSCGCCSDPETPRWCRARRTRSTSGARSSPVPVCTTCGSARTRTSSPTCTRRGSRRGRGRGSS